MRKFFQTVQKNSYRETLHVFENFNSCDTEKEEVIT